MIGSGAESSLPFPLREESYAKTLFIKELIGTNFLGAFPLWTFAQTLAISRYAELCPEHQDKYPVIAVTLKDLSANSGQ